MSSTPPGINSFSSLPQAFAPPSPSSSPVYSQFTPPGSRSPFVSLTSHTYNSTTSTTHMDVPLDSIPIDNTTPVRDKQNS